MSLLDWIIVTIVVVSVFSAARSGLVVEVCSLGGAILGLLLACWNYQRLLPWLGRWVYPLELTRIVAFIMIALGTMIAAGLLGRMMRWSLRMVGLGWLDRLAGAAFGLVKGAVLSVILIVAITAFAPRTAMLRNSRFAPYFMAAAHGAALVSPSELSGQIRHGIDILRGEQSEWFTHGVRVP